jgi:23S rRNA pseudouridine1911/1915/1917 synthase
MQFPFVFQFDVEPYLDGVRIDSFLCKHLRNYTRFRIQRLVQAGMVRVNGVPVEITHKVHIGQQVAIRLVEPPDKPLNPEPIPLEILHEDAWLIVVVKPAGQVVHPVGPTQTGTLCHGIQHHLDQQTLLPGLLQPGIVHRLDRMTSGVMVVLKEHLSHRLLSIEFQQQRVAKTYLALVEGVISQETGTLDDALGIRPGGDTILMTTDSDARHRRDARTDFEVVERFPENTLVRAKPLTGRLHQIRVHFAAIGHPVVGDEFYDCEGAIRQSRFDYGFTVGNQTGIRLGLVAERHALHACTLAFMHPIITEWMEFEAPPPGDLTEAIRCLRENPHNRRDPSNETESGHCSVSKLA